LEFPSRNAITRVQTSRNVDISRNSNDHISVVHEATVTWLGTLVVLQVLCMLYDLDPIQGQGQGHGAFELPKISEAVHVCGDDRPPPFWFWDPQAPPPVGSVTLSHTTPLATPQPNLLEPRLRSTVIPARLRLCQLSSLC